MTLRSNLIRLAHSNPDLRADLLPILQKEAGRWTMPRNSYIPKDNPTLKRVETPEGLEIWTWETMGIPYAIAFAGKANNYLWYNIFRRDPGQRERLIAEQIKSYQAQVDAKRKRMEEKRNFQHGLKEGDVLVSSWGYDQTNIDYYVVTRLYDRAVGIREVGKVFLKNDGDHTSDRVVPDPRDFIGPEMKKIPQSSGGSRSVYVKVNSHTNAYPWDGKPDRQTNSLYGH